MSPTVRLLAGLAAGLLWVAPALVVAWRLRDSRSLDDVPADPPADAPTLSVIVPARDEARNVGRLVRTVLASSYPRLELVLVDDASRDGTADVAREAGAGDPRLRVVANAPLPRGWFGKQWACATGAAAARGELLLFSDADTAHGPELHARAVNMLRSTDAALLTVAGRQELGSFWERMVQPQVFQIILARFPGTERVNRARSPRDKIANGQFLLFRRDAYERLGGHHAVRATVAEDLALAQRTAATGERVILTLGERHLATRMYTSLGELVGGWRKNVFAGGREAMPWGRFGRLLFPFLLPLPAVLTLLPVLVLLAAPFARPGDVALAWAASATSVQLLWWAAVYRREGHSAWNALGFPLGAAVLLYIVVTATLRGRRVAWKGREYRHGDPA